MGFLELYLDATDVFGVQRGKGTSSLVVSVFSPPEKHMVMGSVKKWSQSVFKAQCATRIRVQSGTKIRPLSEVRNWST